jgi:hypothetical protein
MTATSRIVPPWVQHLQLDCPVPEGPLAGGCRPGRAVSGATPTQRAPEVADELERVAVLSSN